MKQEHSQNSVALHLMVSRISASSLPSAIRKNSFIINDVPADLHANTDENMLATVLSSILQIVINHTENSCIRIAANVNDKIVNVQMQDNNFNGNVIESDLKQVQTIANKMGGYLSIHTNLKKITSIAFSFPNIPQAA